MTSELVSFHHYNTYPRQSVYRDEVICSRSGGFISADSLLPGRFSGNLKAMVEAVRSNNTHLMVKMPKREREKYWGLVSSLKTCPP